MRPQARACLGSVFVLLAGCAAGLATAKSQAEGTQYGIRIPKSSSCSEQTVHEDTLSAPEAIYCEVVAEFQVDGGGTSVTKRVHWKAGTYNSGDQYDDHAYAERPVLQHVYLRRTFNGHTSWSIDVTSHVGAGPMVTLGDSLRWVVLEPKDAQLVRLGIELPHGAKQVAPPQCDVFVSAQHADGEPMDSRRFSCDSSDNALLTTAILWEGAQTAPVRLWYSFVQGFNPSGPFALGKGVPLTVQDQDLYRVFVLQP